MELNYLLQQAIMNIQNLQEYYEYQIKKTESYVNKEIKKYKYGVILEKYFINTSKLSFLNTPGVTFGLHGEWANTISLQVQPSS